MFGDLDWPLNASLGLVSISWASCINNLRASLLGYHISRGFKVWQLVCHYSFSIICGYCWTTCVCAEPHASFWICRSVWLQSVAVFNKPWKQKLINNFNTYIHLFTTKVVSAWKSEERQTTDRKTTNMYMTARETNRQKTN